MPSVTLRCALEFAVVLLRTLGTNPGYITRSVNLDKSQYTRHSVFLAATRDFGCHS